MKKYRSEKDWRELFAEKEKSSQSAKEFCRTKGINATVFYRKKKLLKNGGGIVRLPVSMLKGTSIEIAVGDITISVRNGFAEQELARVLRCVREAMDA